MKPQIYYIAALAYVDSLLDELSDERGDLPEQAREKEKHYSNCKKILDETNKIINEIETFAKKTKPTLVVLKDKEEELAKKQFNVRNNKEFDSITKEIAYIKSEHEKLTDQLRIESIKLQNLLKIREQQEVDVNKAQNELELINKQIDALSSEQNDEFTFLNNKRKIIAKKIKPEFYKVYSRIREAHPTVAIRVRKNSCAGNIVPSQTLVELRNNKDKLFFEEHTGMIMIPEEIEITDSDIDAIK